MNRLGKILTLGLEKKRAWQLPLIAVFLLLFAGAIWYYANWLAAGVATINDFAELNDFEAVAQALRYRKPSINRKDKNGNTPLHLAARRNNEAIVKLLLSKGADVNARNNRGVTPLHLAARHADLEIVKRLVEAGADVLAEEQMTIYSTALSRAIGSFDEDPRWVRIHQSPELTFKEKNNRTSELALKHKSKIIVEFLLASGVDVNGTGGFYSATPLMYAVDGNNVVLAAILLEAGADVTHREKGPRRNVLFYGAVYLNPNMVKLLLESGADVNAKSALGDTPLHRYANIDSSSSWHRHWRTRDLGERQRKDKDAVQTEICKLLIDAGADPEAVNDIGETPLSFAAQWGNRSLVKLLLDRGIDVNQKTDPDNRTALHYNQLPSAGRYRCWTDGEIIRMLCAAGMRINELDDQRMTPLDTFLILYKNCVQWNDKEAILRTKEAISVLRSFGAKTAAELGILSASWKASMKEDQLDPLDEEPKSGPK